MELNALFKRLGFGKHADEVYRALENAKEGMLVAHIGKETGLARQQVYRNLEELVERRLVRKELRGGRTYYYAEPASRIEEAFLRVGKAMEKEIQKREKLRRTDAPRNIRFLFGSEGIREVFDDVIEHTPKGDTFFRYTSEKNLREVNRLLSPNYRERRDKKKLERLVISNPDSGKQKRSRLERFIKFIEPEAAVFDQNIIQLVYGKRLAFINLTTREAFIIEDEALASFQKVIFRQLYRKL